MEKGVAGIQLNIGVERLEAAMEKKKERRYLKTSCKKSQRDGYRNVCNDILGMSGGGDIVGDFPLLRRE